MSIPGATSATLVLSNVQTSNAGDYTVIVRNAVDSVPSTKATLTVNQPATQRLVRFGSTSGVPGAVVILPIELVAQGNENTIAFSVTFDPAVLNYQMLILGSSMSSGSKLVLNTSQTQNGRLGVLLGLQSGETLRAGTQQIGFSMAFDPAALTYETAAG